MIAVAGFRLCPCRWRLIEASHGLAAGGFFRSSGVLSAKLKDCLYREALKRRMSAADLLRLYVEEGLERPPQRKRAS